MLAGSEAPRTADPQPDPAIETVADAAYRRIRADILSGRLAPGQKLKLDTLKADYGTSVSTLRETLNRLASERLVVAEGQKGFTVPPVSVASLKEIAALRQLLECHALEQSFEAGDIEWEGRIVAAHHKLARLETRMAAGDAAAAGDWKRYDWQFHQSLISACGSKALIAAHAAVFDKYLRYQMTALSYRGDIASGEHHRMLECALRRDWRTACETLRRHVEGGVAHALATGTIR
ncbi:MAG: GntR family transcriptional regulator [Proteobacteria bacterium]|nr:GntR family transcriptional regulator [Pseudomonadota bacterium]